MTSDELFWRLVLVSRSLTEAALLWWLAAGRADESPYQVPSRALAKTFGIDGTDLLRARRKLEADGILMTRVLTRHSTQFTMSAAKLKDAVGPERLGQFAVAQSWSALLQIDPIGRFDIPDLAAAATWSRICILLGSREQAILLAWLHGSRAHVEPLRASSRDMESALGGLVDRRTAMRALTRLQSAGYVEITSFGRAGTEYRLNADALGALLTASPFPEDAAATMPGWANLSFPLLQRLGADPFADAEATQAAEVAALEG
jgi:hypothetical protein